MNKLDPTNFDYNSFDTKPRLQLQVKEQEIQTLIEQTESYARKTIQSIIETGQKLVEARKIFRHNKNGGFAGWWQDFTGKSKQTAYNYINVAEKFNRQTVGLLDIDPSALYFLAQPSVCESTREEAVKRAEKGETITKGVAKEIIDSQKYRAEMNKAFTKITTKRIANGFIKFYKLNYKVYGNLGHKLWLEWLADGFGVSEGIGLHILEAYQRFGENPQVTKDFITIVVNEYLDDIFAFNGYILP